MQPPKTSDKNSDKKTITPMAQPQTVGYDFDGVLHTCVTTPDMQRGGQVDPTYWNVSDLIKHNCLNQEIVNQIEAHLNAGNVVYIITHNSTLGVSGVEQFLKHYNIPIKKKNIIVAKGDKSKWIKQYHIQEFTDDSLNVIEDIRKNAPRCRVTHYLTPHPDGNPTKVADTKRRTDKIQNTRRPQRFIPGNEAIEAKWISNPLSHTLRYAVKKAIEEIEIASKGMSLFQLTTAGKKMGKTFALQKKNSSAHLLLVRSPNDVYMLLNHRNRWMTPGGQVDDIRGTNVLFNTMKREFEEETGGDRIGNTQLPRLKKGWSYYDCIDKHTTARVYIARIDESSRWDVPL